MSGALIALFAFAVLYVFFPDVLFRETLPEEVVFAAQRSTERTDTTTQQASQSYNPGGVVDDLPSYAASIGGCCLCHSGSGEHFILPCCNGRVCESCAADIIDTDLVPNCPNCRCPMKIVELAPMRPEDVIRRAMRRRLRSSHEGQTTFSPL